MKPGGGRAKGAKAESVLNLNLPQSKAATATAGQAKVDGKKKILISSCALDRNAVTISQRYFIQFEAHSCTHLNCDFVSLKFQAKTTNPFACPVVAVVLFETKCRWRFLRPIGRHFTAKHVFLQN